MPKALDISGCKFGRWSVLHLSRIVKRRRQWMCQCECGIKKEIPCSNLTCGLSKSCGCLRDALTQARNDIKKVTLSSARGAAFHALKQAASTRNLELALSKEQALAIMDLPCYYCGKEKSGYSKSRAGVVYRHNGIDRENNSLGYTLENSRPCCTNCNRAKLALSEQEFFDMVHAVARKHPLPV